MNYTSIPERQKQLIRVGYRKDHGTYMPANGFENLHEGEYGHYLALGKRERVRQTLLGLSVYVVIGLIILGLILYSDSKHKTNANTLDQTNSQQSNPGGSGSSGGSTQPSNGLDSNGCYTPATVRSYENNNGCVDFNVGYTYTDSAGTVFIDQLTNYTAGVEVYIPYNSAAASINLSQFQGQNIKVTGNIQNYNGAPQITVTELSQIQIYQ